MRALRIKDWAKKFENSSSKDIKYANWVPMPNAMDSDEYALIMDHDDGMLHFAGWNMIVMIASRGKGEKRGLLVKPDGQPHDASSLARVARVGRGDRHIMQSLVERLVGEMGWLEWVEVEDSAGIPYHSPDTSRTIPGTPEYVPEVPIRSQEIQDRVPAIREHTSRIQERTSRTPGTVPESRRSRAHEGTGNKELGTGAAAAPVVEGKELPPLPPTISEDDERQLLERLHRVTRSEQHLPQGTDLRDLRLAIYGSTLAEVLGVIDQVMARRKRGDPPRSYKFWPPTLLEELAKLRTAEAPRPEPPRIASTHSCLACRDTGVVGGAVEQASVAAVRAAILGGAKWCGCAMAEGWREMCDEIPPDDVPVTQREAVAS